MPTLADIKHTLCAERPHLRASESKTFNVER